MTAAVDVSDVQPSVQPTDPKNDRLKQIIKDLIAKQRMQLDHQAALLAGLRDVEALVSGRQKNNIQAGHYDNPGAPDKIADATKQDEKQKVYRALVVPKEDEDEAAHDDNRRTDTQIIERNRATVSVCMRSDTDSNMLVKRAADYSKAVHGFAWAQKIVSYWLLKQTVVFLIVSNAAFVAVSSGNDLDRAIERWEETPHDTPQPSDLPAAPVWMLCMEVIFSVLFSVELVLRFFAEGFRFFIGGNCYWNGLDSLCLLSIYLDNLAAYIGVDVSFLRVVRVLKALRGLRLLRGLRFMTSLRIVITITAQCLGPLCSSLLVLFGMLFVFCIMLLQLVENFVLEADGADPRVAAIINDFGTFGRTMMALWLAVLGEFHDSYTVLDAASAGLSFLFLVSVLIINLGVLNIITGIFVKQAEDSLHNDWQLAKDIQRQSTERHFSKLSKLFNDLDADNSGGITCDEWDSFLKTAEAHDTFGIIGLDVEQFASAEFFQAVDSDRDGTISREEFRLACMTKFESERDAVVTEMTLKRATQELNKSIDSIITSRLLQMKADLQVSFAFLKPRKTEEHALGQFRRTIVQI